MYQSLVDSFSERSKKSLPSSIPPITKPLAQPGHSGWAHIHCVLVPITFIVNSHKIQSLLVAAKYAQWIMRPIQSYLLRHFWAGLIVLFLTGSAFAQYENGSLVGTIHDPTGAALAGANVTATNLPPASLVEGRARAA
jgi:hypothetical protein